MLSVGTAVKELLENSLDAGATHVGELKIRKLPDGLAGRLGC